MWHRGRWEHLEYQRGWKRCQQFLNSLFSWHEVCLSFLGTRETVDLGNWLFFFEVCLNHQSSKPKTPYTAGLLMLLLFLHTSQRIIITLSFKGLEKKNQIISQVIILHLELSRLRYLFS